MRDARRYPQRRWYSAARWKGLRHARYGQKGTAGKGMLGGERWRHPCAKPHTFAAAGAHFRFCRLWPHAAPRNFTACWRTRLRKGSVQKGVISLPDMLLHAPLRGWQGPRAGRQCQSSTIEMWNETEDNYLISRCAMESAIDKNQVRQMLINEVADYV